MGTWDFPVIQKHLLEDDLRLREQIAQNAALWGLSLGLTARETVEAMDGRVQLLTPIENGGHSDLRIYVRR